MKSRRRALPAHCEIDENNRPAPTDAVKNVIGRGYSSDHKPVTFALCRGKHGRGTPSQRATREALLRAGAQWWECRSANAAMGALRKSGALF
jgi:hypothetical protein